MYKLFTAVLVVALLASVNLAQATDPVKPSSPAPAATAKPAVPPKLSAEEQVDVLKIQAKFEAADKAVMEAEKEIERLKKVKTDAQSAYMTWVADKCKSDDGKSYTVSLPAPSSDDKPSCVAVAPPAAPKEKK
jgi:hypothetical protein